MEDAGRHGLDPRRYHVADEDGFVRDEVLISAFARFVHDIRTSGARGFAVVDPLVERAPVTTQAVRAALRAGEAGQLAAMSPAYEALVLARATWRALWSGLPRVRVPDGAEIGEGETGDRTVALRSRLGLPMSADPRRFDQAVSRRLMQFQLWHGLPATGSLDQATARALDRDPHDYDRLIRANMDRLRILPARPPVRAIEVNIAAGLLRALEGAETGLVMKTIVGHAATPTPLLAGALRYLVLNPYWNLPQDLVRLRVAPRAGEAPVKTFADQGLEALEDWSADARVVDPARVDWAAVRQGARRIRVRQRPGPDNMMGRVKFMLPNSLGIYLHDTPDRALFNARRRTFSAGCVRVENAGALARWLTGSPLPEGSQGAGEQRVDLPRPVPVFLLYKTVEPRAGGGLVLSPDPYEWDPRPQPRWDA